MPSRVINNFLKTKSEKFRDYAKSSMKTLRKRNPELEEKGAVELPTSLAPVVQPLLNRMDECKTKMNQNEPVVKNAIEGMTDNQLSILQNLFPTENGKKRRVACSEDRLLQVASILIEDLECIDQWKNYLTFLKGEILEQWLKSFITEFHSETSSGVAYDNEKFAHFLKDMTAYRRGLRRASGANASSDEVVVEEPRSCIIM